MGFAAKLYSDDRSSERLAVELDGTLRDPAFQPADVEVHDLSATGFRAASPLDLPLGSEVSLGLAGIGMRKARIVRRDTRGYGCEFLAPLSSVEIGQALKAETVVAGTFGMLPTPVASDATVDVPPLPFLTRVAIIMGVSGLLWTGIIVATMAVVA